MLLLLDVRVDVGRTPASAESESVPVVAEWPSKPGSTAPSGTATSSGATPPGGGKANRQTPKISSPTPVPRRFAWPPVAGADSYRVELFQGDTRVFAATTASAELTVPRGWTLDGERRMLTAGKYRWYVWPIVAGQRAQRAVVQATLTVP